MYKVYFLLVFLFICHVLADGIPPTCSSKIYCQGDLLKTVQLAGIFNDSKTFVDMKMKQDEEVILRAFDTFMNQTGHQPTKAQLQEFVDEYFEAGNELENWNPSDFNPNPRFINNIIDKDAREFAKNLTAIWPTLAKRVKDDVQKDSSHYSIIPVPNGFIVPGGRFREYYYWDSYWIIKGLLVSEMYDTVRGMLDNFLSLIKKYGFIPNGGRVYYTMRSQPPLFSSMVVEYYKATKDKTWIKQNIPTIEKEVLNWLPKKLFVKDGKKYYLTKYAPASQGPRPESFREDYNTASMFPKCKQQRVYTDLKGGAESGWDFSSRWLYASNGSHSTNLSDINTQRTIPVDLNSFIYKACMDIVFLKTEIGQSLSASKWKLIAKQIKDSIQEVLWNESYGIWLDFDSKLYKHREYFTISNLAPLWSGAFDENDDKLCDKVMNYLEQYEIFDYMGGTPTTLEHSGEQWDFPNAWPPLQDIMVKSLGKLKCQRAKSAAEDLAVRWVKANMIGYSQTGEMFEKYDAQQPGKYGGGGEYTVQAGFGWTNGVVLDFLNVYFTK